MTEREDSPTGGSGGGGGGGTGGGGQQRRRRPAARSQSARINNRPNAQRRSSLRPAGSDTRIDATALSGGLVCTCTCEFPPPPTPARSPSRSPTRTFQRGYSARLSATSSSHYGGPEETSGWRRGRRNTTVHRKSAAFLDVPPDEPEEGSLRVRSFSFTHKGTGIINRGDSFRKKRSRSNSLANAEGANPEVPPAPASVYSVAMIGAPGVGKTALLSQFQTSEAINPYDRVKDDTNEESVYVMLNGEESELRFNLATEMEKEPASAADAYLVLYSVIDKASFDKAETILKRLQNCPATRGKPAILVANKVDLARSRAVSPQDGKCAACTFGAKFIEVSVGINHNVDELLVGLLTQIRLKGESPATGSGGSRHWYHSHGVLRASIKARQVFTWIFGKEDSKFKNCENLHVL